MERPDCGTLVQSQTRYEVYVNHTSFILYLVTVALTVLANRGNGNRTHFAVQLYLTLVIMLCTLGASGTLPT